MSSRLELVQTCLSLVPTRPASHVHDLSCTLAVGDSPMHAKKQMLRESYAHGGPEMDHGASRSAQVQDDASRFQHRTSRLTRRAAPPPPPPPATCERWSSCGSRHVQRQATQASISISKTRDDGSCGRRARHGPRLHCPRTTTRDAVQTSSGAAVGLELKPP